MLYWLKLGFVKSRKELAIRLQRNEATITRWVSLCKKGGVKALLKMSHPPGNKAIVPAEIVERLKEKLQQPQGFKSYVEVREWLEKDAGVKAAYKKVHKLILGTPKSSIKMAQLSLFDELRSSLKKALEEITPAAISSLTGWNFIINAVLDFS